MISNQILQNTIEGLKGITRIDFCIMDTDGKALASTFSKQENYEDEILSFVESPADSQVVQGYLRSLMNTNWNISCSRMAAEKMSIWWARSQCSRSRIFW